MPKVLDKIFAPKSIAVIGASDRADSIGQSIMKNLTESDYPGKVYPVNINRATVLNLVCYKTIGDVPEEVDLAVICTPAHTVPKVIRQCGGAGVKGLVIISAGFKEVGANGQKLAEEIQTTATQFGMRILGPNCLGFINPHLSLNASFASSMALPGKLAFISQSGALCTSILDWSIDQSVGFSYFISTGSIIDVSFADLIEYVALDEQTSCILIYMERLQDAERFTKIVQQVTPHKPVIVLKAGKSNEGKKATLSHTGSLAGNARIYDVAFRRTGILSVTTIEQLFDCAQALAMQPLPKGNKLAILTNAGGPGVLATDYLMAHGGRLATLSSNTFTQLNELLPSNWSQGNPIDLLGDASVSTYYQALEILKSEPNLDGILVILTPQAITDPTLVAYNMHQHCKDYPKPILAAWMGETAVQDGREYLEAANIPNYRYPENAVDVFLKMFQYQQLKKSSTDQDSAVKDLTFRVDYEQAKSIIDQVYDDDRTQLMEHEAKLFIKSYGIPVNNFQVVQTLEEAASFAPIITYPIVIKVLSPDIAHKTDIGGVKLNINNSRALEFAFEEMLEQVKLRAPNARIHGVLVEPMTKKRFELLMGSKQDDLFGNVIAFGQGGTAVEIIKDVQLELPPINKRLARKLIEHTRIYELLKGYRGFEAVNLEQLALYLCRFSQLLVDFPEIKEIDINPFVMDEVEGVALDAHVVLNVRSGK